MFNVFGTLLDVAEPIVEIIFGIRKRKKVNDELVEKHLFGDGWFLKLYENPVYYDQFISNSRVRKYIEDRVTVEGMIFEKKKRNMLIKVLDKEIHRMKKSS
ncbi:hypothetical protein [Metabacillus sp. RGM 3146]|uniref:hypothetical protein n=1 Tax=Metabacillus sp. RGM 3146 TaxID=3401092 RepID=UPI003B992C2A